MARFQYHGRSKLRGELAKYVAEYTLRYAALQAVLPGWQYESPKAAFTIDQAEQIIHSFCLGVSAHELGKRWGVTGATIHRYMRKALGLRGTTRTRCDDDSVEKLLVDQDPYSEG